MGQSLRKIIRSTDDVPTIFDINRYLGMDKLSAFEWFYLLETRFLIQNEMFERGLSFWVGEGKLSDIEDEEATELLIENFFHNPLSLDLSIDFKRSNGQILPIEISSPDNHLFMRNNLPVSEFYEDNFSLLQSVLNQNSEKLRSIGEDKQLRPILDVVEPLFSSGFYFTDYPITINPYYPDNIIIDELKKMLVMIRSKRGFNGNNKALSQRDLLNWASYKLLPYFDLKLLEVYESIKITNSVICSILYPKGEYGEDNLRKSVEPIRQKVLTQIGFDGADNVNEISIFDALCYLAYGELQENGIENE